MTVVVGTAGHIDHGKTTLLRALTGIDADRLPEEQRRGMTIDVGYAHLALPDGRTLDFVDVPGHDRLVGNMLVGAGEIDASLVVVAADDGPRAQTLEHVELLDALGIRHGLAVITKAGLVDEARLAEVIAQVERLLGRTSLAGSPTIAADSLDGSGMDDVREALVALDRSVRAAGAGGDEANGGDGRNGSAFFRLAIDRVFAVKGRGAVVTGTLRGGRLARGATLRLVPGDRSVRVREIQVHGQPVEVGGPGRTALNLAGVDAADLHRGLVVTDDPAVVESDRLLVRFARSWPDRARARVHLGTAAVDGTLSRSGRDAIELPDGSAAGILRLVTPIAVAAGDRFVLRRSSGAERIVGGAVLDVTPPRGISRRRQTAERVARLASALGVTEVAGGAGGDLRVVDATAAEAADARLDLHGALLGPDGRALVAPDVRHELDDAVSAAVEAADSDGLSLPSARTVAIRALRRAAGADRAIAAAAADGSLDRLAAEGRIVRDGAVVRSAASAATPVPADPRLAVAMDRLEGLLAVAAPPPLAEAARSVGCPPAGIRELERAGRILVVEADLAYAMRTYRDLAARALSMAARAPLTPAAFRDATGTSRKYVMPVLADLDRRGILRRTADGHVPGPRAPQAVTTGGTDR
jgi:selenocysteine-specific elongation factor